MTRSTSLAWLVFHMVLLSVSASFFVWNWDASRKQPTEALANRRKFFAFVSLLAIVLDIPTIMYYLLKLWKPGTGRSTSNWA